MKRKILVTLLAFCLIASLCVVGAAAANGIECAEPECRHVAEVGGLHYTSVEDAISDADAGETITLINDISENVVIPEEKNVVLDLAGQRLTNTTEHTIVNYGTLAIKDSVGSGVVDVITHGKAALYNYGTITVISGGMFTRSQETVEQVPSGTQANSWYTVVNSGTINEIKGGFFTTGDGTPDKLGNLSSVIVNRTGTINSITGGTFLGAANVIKNEGQSIIGTISGGTFTMDNTVNHFWGGNNIIQNYGTIEAIVGGSINAIGSSDDGYLEAGIGGATARYGISNLSYKSNIGHIENIGGNVEVKVAGNSTALFVNGGSINVTGGSYEVTSPVPGDENTFLPAAIKVSGETAVANVSNGNFIGPVRVGTSHKLSITGGTFTGTDIDELKEYFPKNLALTVDSTGKVVPSPDAVAEVDGVPYKTLQDAINAADDGDTVTLVANVNEDITAGTPLKVEKDITIEGRSKTISLKLTRSTDSNGRDKILQVKGEKAKLTLNNVKLEINGFVNTTDENRACGDAIDLYLGGDLEANYSTIDIDDVAAAFVIQTAGETIELNNTTVTADNVRGNGSQGGEWTVNDSSIRFTNCGSHGLSVETADVTNSRITVDGAGFCAVYGKELNFGENTTVNVSNSGPDEPKLNWDKSDTYYGAIQVKLPGNNVGTMTVAPTAVINVSGENNTIYFPANAELINNGAINATVTVPEDSDMCVVVFMADGRQYDVQVVNDGASVRMPTLSKSGYTFTGWRVNNSNTIVKGGESYPITANTTFTAVWNMIMIPDTYDIAVDQPAHGTVDVSLSNASQGSVITVTATPDEGYELVYITVDGEPISGNSFVMPDHAVEVSALFAEIGKEVNFVDVSRADWFYDYVQYVAQNGLMEGTTRTAFEPNASMTRAMFWTVLARIDGETITGDAWKTLAQTWAVESGISDGTNADALITREQMVTMLYRYAGSPVAGGMAISEFTDGASVSDYATDAVTWALSEGILTGMGDGILAPQGTATRAQAAAMLMRFVEA